MSTSQVEHPKVVFRAEWLAARKELLIEEKELTRRRDALNAKRRELPWVKVENYVFDGPRGNETLADLFDGRNQLIVYHFMLVRNGTKAAPAARSTWITRTVPWCTSRSAT
jgi:predicted dithiol-disulfide oxidoreductase (DUF899 family)